MRETSWYSLARLLGVASGGLFLGATLVSVANDSWNGVEAVAWVGFAWLLMAALCMLAGLRSAYRNRVDDSYTYPTTGQTQVRASIHAAQVQYEALKRVDASIHDGSLQPAWSNGRWPTARQRCPQCNAPCVLGDGIILFCSVDFQHSTALARA